AGFVHAVAHLCHELLRAREKQRPWELHAEREVRPVPAEEDEDLLADLDDVVAFPRLVFPGPGVLERVCAQRLLRCLHRRHRNKPRRPRVEWPWSHPRSSRIRYSTCRYPRARAKRA